MKFKIFALLTVLTILVSCKKEENIKYCWQLVNASGNDINAVCDKSLAEMQDLYPGRCRFYKAGGQNIAG